MLGNAGSDRMFGEGGDDTMKGNANDDLMEGNQGRDWLEGNDGEDDLVGGSSFEHGAAGVGDPDAGDFLHGGAGADLVVGDNAVIARTPAGAGTPIYLTTQGRLLGFTTNRWVRLHDLAAAAGDRSGADLLSGGAGPDVAFGQDGTDWLSGGSDDDYLEGNGAADRLYGDRLPSDAGVVEVPALPESLLGAASDPSQLDGTHGLAGQDDMIGGSLLAGHRDGGDVLNGDGAGDFQLGDNGTLTRRVQGTGYALFTTARDATRVVRVAVRHDVGAAATAGAWGGDTLLGDAGDDAQWGQDGNDALRGGDGDDDMHGELGNDTMLGGTGEDAMIGDRGSITNTHLATARTTGDLATFTIDTNGPPFMRYTGFRAGTFDRRVDLVKEPLGSVGGPTSGGATAILSDGQRHGGNDVMRGGPGRDAMHGTFGNDLMNGDTGGDILFGADGADVMWGGRGSADLATADSRGVNDELVDHLFGGRGGSATTVTGGADVLDYEPRPGIDPQAWHDAVAPYEDEPLPQSHQGVDWIYGGWGRDVMQGNITANGPNDGDRMLDWSGAYNLYTHCNAAYGGQNDVRAISPTVVSFLERLAHGLGVGSSVRDVQASTSSAFNELALVYNKDMGANSGSAYPGTPGNFTAVGTCTP
jgi:Ca2+-binding RTX toxin-like protein